MAAGFARPEEPGHNRPRPKARSEKSGPSPVQWPAAPNASQTPHRRTPNRTAHNDKPAASKGSQARSPTKPSIESCFYSLKKRGFPQSLSRVIHFKSFGRGRDHRHAQAYGFKPQRARRLAAQTPKPVPRRAELNPTLWDADPAGTAETLRRSGLHRQPSGSGRPAHDQAERLLRPFCRRLARIFRPSLVFIRLRKPHLRFRLMFDLQRRLYFIGDYP